MAQRGFTFLNVWVMLLAQVSLAGTDTTAMSAMVSATYTGPSWQAGTQARKPSKAGVSGERMVENIKTPVAISTYPFTV